MDEKVKKEIEELRALLNESDARKQMFGTPWSVPATSATAVIEEYKQQQFAEAQRRRLDEQRRKAIQEMEIKQLMEMQAIQGPIFTPIRPTPEYMARQIHEARCQIVAMTIMGDLYAK